MQVIIQSVGDVYQASDGTVVGIGRTAREALAHFYRLVSEMRILRATMA